MKHLVALVLLLSITPATTQSTAPTMPKELRGGWCDKNTALRRCHGLGDMHVTARGYETEDWVCTALKITRLDAGYRITFSCRDGGGNGDAQANREIWIVKNGALFTRDE